MRLIYATALFGLVPGLLFLIVWPFAGWRIALVLPAVWMLMMAYGWIFGWRRIMVRRAECQSPLLPKEFDGYTIVQLSDIHIGTFLRNRRFITHLVDVVNEQKPDMIVFTGDLVNVEADEVIPFLKDLHRLHAPDGVYSILGNHDYCEYMADTSRHNLERNQLGLVHLEERVGWHLLMDEHAIIRRGDAEIAIIGVENISRPPFPEKGNLAKAMKGLPDGMFKILLSHDPSHWRRGVLHHTDIALTLSGHTHAGQMKFGRFSPARWAYNEWGGKYTEGGSMLYVSLGVGGTVPFRFGAWPEINLIKVKR